MENIVEKGKIAHFEQFHLFPQCIPKAFFLYCVKMGIYEGKGYTSPTLQIYNPQSSFHNYS